MTVAIAAKMAIITAKNRPFGISILSTMPGTKAAPKSTMQPITPSLVIDNHPRAVALNEICLSFTGNKWGLLDGRTTVGMANYGLFDAE